MNEKAQLLLDFFDKLRRGGPSAPRAFVRAARARRPPSGARARAAKRAA